MTLKERLKGLKRTRKKLLKYRKQRTFTLTWLERDRLPVLRKYYENYRSTLRMKKDTLEWLGELETMIVEATRSIKILTERVKEQQKVFKQFIRMAAPRTFSFDISRTKMSWIIAGTLFNFSFICTIFRAQPTCIRKGMGRFRIYGHWKARCIFHFCDLCLGGWVNFGRETFHFGRRGIYWSMEKNV